MQVTNITKLKVKYKIDLENGKHFYVSEDTIIKYGLIKKIDLSKEQLKEIIDSESDVKEFADKELELRKKDPKYKL